MLAGGEGTAVPTDVGASEETADGGEDRTTSRKERARSLIGATVESEEDGLSSRQRSILERPRETKRAAQGDKEEVGTDTLGEKAAADAAEEVAAGLGVNADVGWRGGEASGGEGSGARAISRAYI